MNPEAWGTVSAWLDAWLSADAAEREQLRAQLAAQHPELVTEAETLATAGSDLGGFLETPALVLAARELAEADHLLTAGAMIGPYRVVSLLARGGMGDVYHATDLRLQREVAVKVLAESRTGDPQRVQRFMHEARVTASLDHPNVVRVYDVGRVGERTYLVAELLEGETLRERISRGPMPGMEVVRIGSEIARGLAAAHAAGLVHRDLKPENVFLMRSGTAKLLDFGIAKLAQDETVRSGLSTLTGVVLGTAGYLAPEQIRGQEIDPRADLFALGAVLFEMLTGTRAFAREHIVETLHAILHDPPPDSLAERADVSPALYQLVMRLLEKAPEGRFQSSEELIAALETLEPANTHGDGRPWLLRPVTGNRTRRTAASAGVLSRAWGARQARIGLAFLAVAAAIGTAVWQWQWDRTASPTPAGTEMTLAVIPFRSIPAAEDGGLLELGLADVFISRLGQLAEVRVLPLSASERLRDLEDARQAARTLGATHVLTGTLQRERGLVRAIVQLVSTADQRTVWSTPVDTDSASAFSIQDIIVTRVVEEFAPHLAPRTQRRLAQPGTRSNDAFEAYLRGRALVGRPTGVELARAAERFEEAVRLDPGFADAWAGLASAHKRMPLFDANPSHAFLQARRAASRALDLQPEHAEAQSVLGTVAFWHEWNYPKAETLLRRALDLQPSSADSNVLLAHLLSNLGRHDEALVEIRRARALDPVWPVPRSLEGQFLFMARRYEDALTRLDQIVALHPRFAPGHTMRAYPLLSLGRYEDAVRECDRVIALNYSLGSARPHAWAVALRGYAFARMGREADAGRVLEELGQRARHHYVPPHHQALVLHALGRDEEALERLRAGVDDRDVYVTFLGVDPKWDALRGTPAFRDLLRRVHLLEVSDQVQR